MDVTLVILRLIHIFSGVFWVGGTFFLLSFVQPTVAATGEAGQKFMQHLGMKTRLSTSMAGAGTLSLLTGATMWNRFFGTSLNILDSGYGRMLTLGALCGILALISGLVFQYRAISHMKALGQQIAAAGGPPTPEQMAEMQKWGGRLDLGGRIGGLLMTLALIGMSTAQAAG